MQETHQPPTRPWIPPWGLVAGQLAHGLSWVLLFLLAGRDQLGFSFPGLAWVHLVALGWLTLIALAILVHVLPGFLDLEWRGEAVARWMLLPYVLGVAGMVLAFWFSWPPVLHWSAGLVVAALIGYLIPAVLTLRGFRPESKMDIRVRRAFYLVMAMLALAALLGLALAEILAHGGPSWFLNAGPAIHAHLGGVGWLSLLVFGVSVRTVRPITGDRSPAPWRHMAASVALLVGLLVQVAGLAGAGRLLTAAGTACCAAAVLLYVIDMADILRRATVPHRPPQAFIAVACLYFVLAAFLGAGVLAGRREWQAAYVFTGLMGWLGQMVNGHLHHIGIRLLATLARGEEDETRPGALLSAPLSWIAWMAFQIAVLGTVGGLLAQNAGLVQMMAVTGLLGWLSMVGNVFGAWRRARRPGGGGASFPV